MSELFDVFMEIDAIAEKPRDTYVRAPFAWPGGKFRSLPEIIPRLPSGNVFIDACGGSGVVTLNVPAIYKLRVFNDRYAGVVAFYRCLRDHVKMTQLIERLKLTVHSREEWVWCANTWENPTEDVERAARWYYMCYYSFATLGRNFGRVTTSRNSLAIKFQNQLSRFPEIHNGFRDVQIENMDVQQLIRDFDSSDAVFYIDPDYIGADPGIYQHRVQHRNLLELIHKEANGFFAISGYANELYDSYAWDDRVEWDVVVTLRSKAYTETNNLLGKETMMKSNSTAKEVLWIREAR